MEEILLVVLGVALYLLWLLLAATCKFIIRIVSSIWNDVTGETARRKKRQEEAQKKEEERKEHEMERQRKRRQAEAAERQRFRAENKEIFTGIRNLLSTCATPAMEIMRAMGAIEGEEFEANPKHVVWLDVGFILASLRKTGSGIDYIDKLWEEVTRAIRPPDVDGLPSLNVVPNRAVEQLGLVSFLASYDTQRGTDFTSKAASTYHSIVSAVATHCDGSLAAKMVADKYIELLSSYIHESGRNGYAGNASSSAGSQSNRKSVCRKCIEDYGLLGLPVAASKDEIGQRKRDCAEVLHRDKLVEKSERVRNAAEQQLKIVNAACDRILRCGCSFSTN
jgi:Na+-transporting methylmalonyl-CoA/oxaloacetate decarboxylase gamma subunit